MPRSHERAQWLRGTLAYTEHRPVGHHALRTTPLVIIRVMSVRCTAPSAVGRGVGRRGRQGQRRGAAHRIILDESMDVE